MSNKGRNGLSHARTLKIAFPLTYKRISPQFTYCICGISLCLSPLYKTRESARILILSPIIGRAASTGRTRTMTGMMTAMTDFGVKGNSDRKDFRISDFSCFIMGYDEGMRIASLFSCAVGFKLKFRL